MTEPERSCHRIRTGLFEIDAESGEVLKDGRIIPLQEQPFRVLMVLLQKPGNVVTRDELRARIWPDGTFVSFDEGLNTAIRKLRIIFGDSAENPRYIETIPKRGYRFIAPVSPTSDGNGSLPETTVQMRHSLPADGKEHEIGIEPEKNHHTTRARELPRSWKFLVVVGGAAMLTMGLVLVKHSQRVESNVSNVPKRVMLAVLPFQNLSDDVSQEYFSDGLTEETITDLGQLSPMQLGVIARTSAMTYKHTDKTIAQIGRELGVDFVLEGSVRRENGRARISAQLIRVGDQTHLWAQNYDAQASGDFLDIQNEIGRAIAEQVQTEISPQYQHATAKARATNPEAYDLYLRGRFYWNQRTPASIAQSIDVLQLAIKADPNFAQPYAALADSYNIGNIVGLYSPGDSLPQAKKAASRAIELDPSLAEAHAALGMALSHFDFDFPGAKREFLKAIELNPNSAYAHLFYSNCYLLPMGRSAEALAENKKAIELDPLSLPINNFLGMTYLYAGDYEAAEKQFRSTIAMNPNFPLSHSYIAFLYEIRGRYPEAIAEAVKGDQLSGSNLQDVTGRAQRLEAAYKRDGKRGYWLERMRLDEELMKRSTRGISPVTMAMDASMAGEKQTSLTWLNQSYEAREGGELTLLAVDPGWDNLRDEPEFNDLLRRIGLPTDLTRQ